jgi:hypothetical protein
VSLDDREWAGQRTVGGEYDFVGPDKSGPRAKVGGKVVNPEPVGIQLPDGFKPLVFLEPR